MMTVDMPKCAEEFFKFAETPGGLAWLQSREFRALGEAFEARIVNGESFTPEEAAAFFRLPLHAFFYCAAQFMLHMETLETAPMDVVH